MADDAPLPQILHLLGVLSVQVGATQAGVQRLESRVDSLATEMRTGFDRVERRLGNLETRVEGIETRLERVETRVESIAENLEKRVSALESPQ
jgi:predicted RNase H-like nuclease (RuvC/YqgF family)